MPNKWDLITVCQDQSTGIFNVKDLTLGEKGRGESLTKEAENSLLAATTRED